MDAFLAVVSRREVRRYAVRAIPHDVQRRILEAGRLSGSAGNRQPWRFVVLRDRQLVERAAAAVWAPDNLLGAALVVAIVVRGRGPLSFDAGRASQNMMLVAWNDGVGSCPNGVRDPSGMAGALALAEEDQVAIVLSFGYPAHPVDPHRRSPEDWIGTADRRPFEEVVDWR